VSKIKIGILAATGLAIFGLMLIPRHSSPGVAAAALARQPAAVSVSHATAGYRPYRPVATSASDGTTTAELMLYTVLKGDSLSAVAARTYGTSRDWPLVWWNNRAGIPDPDSVPAGMVLKLGGIGVVTTMTPAIEAAAQAALPKPPPPPVSTALPVSTASSGDSGGVPASQPQPQPVPATASGPWPGGAFGNCVVMRESGGNPNVMNSTGHYGLYQFSASTWAAYGGNPGSFGNASVAEQEQVFMNALAQGGQSNWSPYDGC
jgi:hypothetical protein